MPLSKSKKIDVLGILVKPQYSDGSKVKKRFRALYQRTWTLVAKYDCN